jgi:hypothetical protein
MDEMCAQTNKPIAQAIKLITGRTEIKICSCNQLMILKKIEYKIVLGNTRSSPDGSMRSGARYE